MIVKVQRSISTTHSNEQVLVYDKDGRFEWTGDMPLDVADMFERHGYPLKMYCRAHFNRKREIVIDRKVKDREW